MARFAMVLWGIWFNRNQLLHKKCGRDPGELVYWVAGLLEEFQGTYKSLLSSLSSDSAVAKEGWHPPPLGCLKLNTDAAVPPGGNCFGIGAVIRDSEGNLVLALSKFVLGYFSVEVCEALALRKGLSLAKQHGLSIGWAEVDAVNVDTGVNSSQLCRSTVCFVFNDISALCRDVWVSECKAISICGNGVAHNHASLSVSSSRDHLWQGHCPFSLFSGC
ncbi:hypothetical protein Dsin_007989 [Dipteronia sinensis]|uniref:RNase H type-1 domain-containing protein n=1 Tax=Dipteronia sinensis TaxID=43782 RepID=A0AAE0EHL8_9ROSI|nr:hypothetical protein Dsin_007989 [Dipteronia sinensis]